MRCRRRSRYTETERLRAALVNVLQAAGVATSIDLLRASFNADGTGMDRVMDIVKVTVNPASGVAEIKNILNNSAASYDIAAPGTIAAILSSPVTTLNDVDQIRLGTKAFFDKFATSVPSLQQLQGLGLIDEARFKHGGLDFNSWYSLNLNDSAIIGITFTGVTVTNLTATTADVEVIFFLFGESQSLVWKFSKVNGVWKALGDQRIAEVSIGAAGDRHPTGS